MLTERLSKILLCLCVVAIACVATVVGCTPTPGGGGGQGTLTLSLDPSLDDAGTVKAPTITSAVLLNTTGQVIATATVTAGAAGFDLSGLGAGNYFVRVNDLGDDLVPTHIDDPTANVS